MRRPLSCAAVCWTVVVVSFFMFLFTAFFPPFPTFSHVVFYAAVLSLLTLLKLLSSGAVLDMLFFLLRKAHGDEVRHYIYIQACDDGHRRRVLSHTSTSCWLMGLFRRGNPQLRCGANLTPRAAMTHGSVMPFHSLLPALWT